MEFKGTKGYWNNKAFNDSVFDIRSDGGENIGYVYNTKNGTANAKLIACAPETIVNLNISNEILRSVLSLFMESMALTTKFGIISQIDANDELIKKATTI